MRQVGPALHAAFNLFSNPHFSPHQLAPREVKLILNRMSGSHLMPKMTNVFVREVIFCWCYLKELLDLSDNFQFEPPLSGLIHDLRIHHKGRIYVIEIKTVYMPARTKLKTHHGQGIKQVREGMEHVYRMLGPDTPVYGYVLNFVFLGDGREPEITWIDVHTSLNPSA